MEFGLPVLHGKMTIFAQTIAHLRHKKASYFFYYVASFETFDAD